MSKEDESTQDKLARLVEQGSSDSVPGMEIQGMGDLYLPIKPIQWLVYGLFERSQVGFLFGKSGAGKSMVALSLALSIAFGRDWCGRKTQQGKVLYMTGGEGVDGLQRRVHAWAARHKETLAPDIPFFFVDHPVDLSSEAAASDAAKAIIAAGIDDCVAIFVDTLRRHSGGADENDNREMAAFLINLEVHLRRINDCVVFVIHHTGHMEGGRMRGASSLRDTVGFTAAITRPGSNPAIEMKMEKIKEGGCFDPVYFKMDKVELTNTAGDPEISVAAVHVDTEPEEMKQAKTGESTTGTALELLDLVRELMSDGFALSRDAFIHDAVVRGIVPDRKTARTYLARLRKRQLVVVENNEIRLV